MSLSRFRDKSRSEVKVDFNRMARERTVMSAVFLARAGCGRCGDHAETYTRQLFGAEHAPGRGFCDAPARPCAMWCTMCDVVWHARLLRGRTYF